MDIGVAFPGQQWHKRCIKRQVLLFFMIILSQARYCNPWHSYCGSKTLILLSVLMLHLAGKLANSTDPDQTAADLDPHC